MINRTQEEIIQSWGELGDTHPLVSIKCMTYNHENYIAQAIDGFLMQRTTFPVEILIHDDASTDKTASIVHEYEIKYPKIIKVIYEKENQYKIKKHHEKINALIKGKYIAICEGDDYWTDSNKLQMQVDFLESHPDYSMCFHGAEVKYDDDLYTHAEFKSVENKDYSAEELIKQWLVPTMSIVMRRECIDYPIKSLSAIVYRDVFTIFSCLAMGKVYGFSKIMSVYRVNSNSVTHNPKYERNLTLKMPEHWECFKESFPFCPKRSVDKALAFHYWQRANIQSNIKQTFQDRKKAILHSPFLCFLLIFRPLFLASINLSSKHFDTNGVRSFIRKIINRI